MAIQGALRIAIIKSQKFAKGGWTGDGGDRDETGERVAGVVHEKEFVVKKGPANKFRDVLEAINKEEKSLENKKKEELKFANTLKSARKGDKGIYWTTFKGRRQEDEYYAVEQDGIMKCSCGRELVKVDEDTYKCSGGFPFYRFTDGTIVIDKFGNLLLKKEPHKKKEESNNEQN